MKPQDPTPSEIAAACLEIQSEWTAQERMKRPRPDLRPTFNVADGRRLEMSSEAYSGHHSEHEAMAGVNGSRLGPSLMRSMKASIMFTHSLSRRSERGGRPPVNGSLSYSLFYAILESPELNRTQSGVKTFAKRSFGFCHYPANESAPRS
jgi:hypothetical protein